MEEKELLEARFLQELPIRKALNYQFIVAFKFHDVPQILFLPKHNCEIGFFANTKIFCYCSRCNNFFHSSYSQL